MVKIGLEGSALAVIISGFEKVWSSLCFSSSEEEQDGV